MPVPPDVTNCFVCNRPAPPAGFLAHANFPTYGFCSKVCLDQVGAGMDPNAGTNPPLPDVYAAKREPHLGASGESGGEGSEPKLPTRKSARPEPDPFKK